MAVFDLDGTLIDSDASLVAPFVALGVPREAVTFGHVLDAECARLGVAVDQYLELYDPTSSRPFPGVQALLASLERWAVCSNKHPRVGREELARLGWTPVAALFSDAFGGAKRLEPVLEALGAVAGDIVYVGDTDHDRACAAAAGCEFAWAGWNPRVEPHPGDQVLARPAELLALLHPAT